jgi:hypothetical protein
MRSWAIIGAFALVACGDEGSGIVRVKAEGFFDPVALDFGVRALGISHNLDLVMTNSSGAELLVTDVTWEPSTDAFAARLAEGGTLKGAKLDRNQKRNLKMIFGPGEEKAYSTTMVVVSDDLEIELPIEGVGRRVEPARLTVSPASITFIEPIEVGREARQPLRIENAGELPGFLSVISTPPGMSVLDLDGSNAAPSMEIAAGDGVDIELRFRPQTTGAFEETARFITNGGVETELPVRGTAVTAGTLTCDRTSLEFGTAARGSEVRRMVTCDVAGGIYTLEQITFNTGSPLLAMENVSASPGVSLTRLTFELVFRPLGLPQQVSGTVAIQSATGQTVTIAVTGSVEPPAPEAAELALVLSWSTPNTDFDLHFVRSGSVPFQVNQDCHFAQKTLDWNQSGNSRDDPFLDRDATTGPGTEQLTMIEAGTGTYDVYVQFFRQPNTFPAPMLTLALTVQGGPNLNLMRTMGTCGNTWRVGTLHFENSPPTFSAIDDETNAYAGFATSCP